MKVDRLLSIIVYLLNRELASAGDLARRFGVTVRTIQRDMEAINLSGIPVISVPGPHGGYGILDSFKMDRQLLSMDDFFNIVTALAGIGASLEDRRISDTLEKVQGLVPTSSKPLLREREEKLHVDFSMLGGGPRQRGVFKVVQAAVESSRLLRMTYTNNRLERAERLVEPMTLVFTWRSWYLFGFCRMRRDYRLFRLSRIRDPAILSERFARRDMSYERFSRESTPESRGELVDLTLRFAPEVLPIVEEIYAEEDLERADDGSATLRTRMPEDGWLYGHILSYGEYVEVLKPEHIRPI
ncbi:MAG: YafY family protein, partial [Spirochaetaceae bacterium]|nr:YafY family protein [Spirochaetaceae bacterium]